MIRDLHYLKAMGYDFIDIHSNISHVKNNFQELHKNIKNCNLCHFSKSRKYILMEAEQKNAKLMVLSAHGSKEENNTGILLNSKNGLFLKNNLETILNLKQDEYYISYIFKCFNTKFDDFSLQSCLPYFWNELNIIKPKILLCLGEYVFKSLGFNNFALLRGEIFTYENFSILPSFDLEFLEKNPSHKKDFLDDLEKIKGFL